jgi:oligosaccharide repeat unit polymerase
VLSSAADEDRFTHPLMGLLFPAALLAAGVAVPLVLGSHITLTPATFLLLIVGVYSGVRLVMVLFNGRAQVLQLFFWMFAWVFYGLAPVAQLVGGRWPWPGDIGQATMLTVCSMLLISFVCYDIGLLASWRTDTAQLRAARYRLSAGRLKIAAPVAVALCLYGIFRTGPANLIGGRESRTQATVTSAGSLDTVSLGINTALMVTSVFVVAYLYIRAKRLGAMPGRYVTVGLLVLLALFVSNPTSTARYRVASVAGGLVLAIIWPIGRALMAWLGAAILGGIAFIFPALNAFRRVGGTLTFSRSLVDSLQSGDYDAFQQIANTVSYVHDLGHTFGRQALSSLLFFIPRSLWSGKSLDTGVVVATHQGYAFKNLSAPLQAEAYIDGGFPLVIVLFLALGLITGRFERRAREARHMTGFVALLVPLVAAYQLIVLRGSLLQAMAGLVTLVLFTWLCTERATLPPITFEVRSHRPGDVAGELEST